MLKAHPLSFVIASNVLIILCNLGTSNVKYLVMAQESGIFQQMQQYYHKLISHSKFYLNFCSFISLVLAQNEEKLLELNS